MQAAAQVPSSDDCYNCGGLGHRRNNCPKPQRLKQQQLHKKKTSKGKKKGGQGSYCSYHQYKSHSDAECLKQKEFQQQAGAINVANIGKAHLPAQAAVFGTSASGFSFAAARAWRMAEEKKTSPITRGPSVAPLRKKRAADTLRLFGAFTEPPDGKPQGGRAKVASSPVARTNANNTVLKMMVDSGSTAHYLDSDLIPGLQNRMVDYKELDKTHKIVTAGHHTLEGVGTGTINGSVTD